LSEDKSKGQENLEYQENEKGQKEKAGELKRTESDHGEALNDSPISGRTSSMIAEQDH
jgi:hypothetical protein